MLNQKDFINKIYRKSKNIDLKDDFYNTEVYKEENNINFAPYKIVANFVIALILFGTVGAIAYTTYQSISQNKKIPQYNWSDGSVKFNEKYEDYSKPVGEIVGTHNDTTLELISQNYDGGMIVLEFNLKLSEEDKEYLRVGEKTFTSDEIESYRASYNGLADEKINSYDSNLSEEKNNEIHEKWQKGKEEYAKELEKMSLEKNAVKLFLNGKKGERYSYKIDGEKVILLESQKQQIEQINDTEFKIYQMYFIPDEYIENKDSFTLEFENNYLSQAVDRSLILNADEENQTWYFLERSDFEDVENFELTGQFSVVIQNNNEVEYIDYDNKTISHDILTENIEYIRRTPMQTVIKIKSKLDGIKFHTLSTSWVDWNDPDLIGNINFNIYDGENNIGALVVESKRDVWYVDGKYVEWEPYQIAPYWWDGDSPIGGKMKITTYIIISNEDYKDNLKIYPTITKRTNKDKEYKSELDDYFEVIYKK